MKFVHYAVLICACFLLISCDLELEPATEAVVQFDQEQFDRERAAWNASNIKNYRFDMYADGMASRSIIRFVVENGAFKERKIIQSGQLDYLRQNGFTIPAFYAEIEWNVQNAWKIYGDKNPDEIRYVINVVYNTAHHYPVSINTCELHAVGNNTFEGEDNSGIKLTIKNFSRTN
jgi:hypothetical protein